MQYLFRPHRRWFIYLFADQSQTRNSEFAANVRTYSRLENAARQTGLIPLNRLIHLARLCCRRSDGSIACSISELAYTIDPLWFRFAVSWRSGATDSCLSRRTSSSLGTRLWHLRVGVTYCVSTQASLVTDQNPPDKNPSTKPPKS